MLSSKNIFDDDLHFEAPRYLSAEHFQIENKRTQVVPGDVLLTIVGTIGRCAVVLPTSPKITLQRSVAVLRPRETEIDSRFLMYSFLERTSELHTLARGVAQKGVYLETLRDLSVAFPALAEQQRIVGILDEAFDGIATAKANAEKNLQNARALFESHLQAVFAQRDVDWEETTLENVLAEQPRNGWSPPAANHAESGCPVLTLSSVTGFQFRAHKIKFTSAKTDSRRHYWVRDGDFLLTRSNTPELVGHVAIASGIMDPTIYPDLIMRMTPAPNRMLTKFLWYQMRTPALRLEITGRAQGANPTMKKVGKSAVQTLPIVAPPIRAQAVVVEQLDDLSNETQRLESLYQRKLSALNELKKSLLHQAFSGAL
jgi:type I restriction enzyme, S subunit